MALEWNGTDTETEFQTKEDTGTMLLNQYNPSQTGMYGSSTYKGKKYCFRFSENSLAVRAKKTFGFLRPAEAVDDIKPFGP